MLFEVLNGDVKNRNPPRKHISGGDIIGPSIGCLIEVLNGDVKNRNPPRKHISQADIIGPSIGPSF